MILRVLLLLALALCTTTAYTLLPHTSRSTRSWQQFRSRFALSPRNRPLTKIGASAPNAPTLKEKKERMILRSTTVPSPSTKGEGEAAGGGEGVMAADLLMDELGELEWQVKAKLDEAVKVSMDGCVCV